MKSKFLSYTWAPVILFSSPEATTVTTFSSILPKNCLYNEKHTYHAPMPFSLVSDSSPLSTRTLFFLTAS